MALSIRDAMQVTGLTYGPIYKSILSGKIKATKVDSGYLIPEEELSKLPKPRTRRLKSSEGEAQKENNNVQKVEVPQGIPFLLHPTNRTPVIAIGEPAIAILQTYLKMGVSL